MQASSPLAQRTSTRATRGAWMWLAALALCAWLSGCGTPYATVRNAAGEDVMLLGYDPVAYFTQGKPVRGDRQHKVTLPDRTYYFASAEHKQAFEAAPQRYEPQYGGFCSSGAAFAVKLGSDPTAWQIEGGRLFVFGDVIGHEMWKLDAPWNIRHADELWPDMRDRGWRVQSLYRYVNKVPHYKTGRELMDEWKRRNPGKTIDFDPGGMVQNLFLKSPGWRAAEGFGQPALGYPD
jgi:YHS domain-containing protein